jgi:hypothetical protein
MSKEREAKQDYLRTEIILKGFIPSQFAAFAEAKKPKGTDL